MAESTNIEKLKKAIEDGQKTVKLDDKDFTILLNRPEGWPENLPAPVYIQGGEGSIAKIPLVTSYNTDTKTHQSHMLVQTPNGPELTNKESTITGIKTALKEQTIQNDIIPLFEEKILPELEKYKDDPRLKEQIEPLLNNPAPEELIPLLGELRGQIYTTQLHNLAVDDNGGFTSTNTQSLDPLYQIVNPTLYEMTKILDQKTNTANTTVVLDRNTELENIDLKVTTNPITEQAEETSHEQKQQSPSTPNEETPTKAFDPTTFTAQLETPSTAEISDLNTAMDSFNSATRVIGENLRLLNNEKFSTERRGNTFSEENAKPYLDKIKAAFDGADESVKTHLAEIITEGLETGGAVQVGKYQREIQAFYNAIEEAKAAEKVETSLPQNNTEPSHTETAPETTPTKLTDKFNQIATWETALKTTINSYETAIDRMQKIFGDELPQNIKASASTSIQSILENLSTATLHLQSIGADGTEQLVEVNFAHVVHSDPDTGNYSVDMEKLKELPKMVQNALSDELQQINEIAQEHAEYQQSITPP